MRFLFRVQLREESAQIGSPLAVLPRPPLPEEIPRAAIGTRAGSFRRPVQRTRLFGSWLASALGSSAFRSVAHRALTSSLLPGEGAPRGFRTWRLSRTDRRSCARAPPEGRGQLEQGKRCAPASTYTLERVQRRPGLLNPGGIPPSPPRRRRGAARRRSRMLANRLICPTMGPSDNAWIVVGPFESF